MSKIDLGKIKKVYCIGIKGSGVVAVVEILKALGISVTGSDTGEKFFTDEVLQKLGVPYVENFAPENIPSEVDLVVHSTVYREDNNVEMAEVKKRGLLTISYPEILGLLFNQRYGVAVCGTHGKTTTSAMLAEVLQKCGKDPGAVIGSRVRQWGGNALTGKGELFVLEADEFQNKLRFYDPNMAILTSVDWDHPDFYPTFGEYKKAFSDFVARIPNHGLLVVYGDSSDTLEVAKEARCEVIKYGFQEGNDLIIKKQKAGSFEAIFKEKSLGMFETQLIGDHNLLNVAAVVAVCHKLNIDLDRVREALKSFQGTSRRFEVIGERNGALLVDDYGHHPEEIKVTLKAARELYPEKNIIAVFHPHSYSRTESLLEDFAQSFDDVNQILVLDIYGSARESSGKVTSKDLVELINKYNHDKAEHIATIPEVIDLLKDKIGNQDVVISIGAGNVWEVTHQLKV